MSSFSLNDPIVTSEEAIGVLGHIKSILLTQVNPQLQSVIHTHPEIGSVLSALCGNPNLLVEEQVSSLVLECLLWFYQPQLDGPLGTRASLWLSHQLGKCLSLPQPPQSLIGVCQWKWDEAWHKMKLIVAEALNRHPALDTTASIWFAKFGLLLVNQPDKDGFLAGKLLKAFDQSAKSILSLPDIHAFLEVVWLHSKKGRITLSSDSTFHLWNCYKPSLEWEILTLLEKLDGHSQSHVQLAWENENLEKACRSSAHILGSVLRIVCSLTVRTSFSSLLLNFLHVVQQTIQKCPPNLLLEAFPAHLHCSIVLLQVDVNDMPPEEIPGYLNCILNSLYINTKDLATKIDVTLLWMIFPSWLAILLAHIGSQTYSQVHLCTLQIQATLPNGKNPCLQNAVRMLNNLDINQPIQAIQHILSNTFTSCCRGIAFTMMFLRFSTLLSPVAVDIPSSFSQLRSWCHAMFPPQRSKLLVSDIDGLHNKN